VFDNVKILTFCATCTSDSYSAMQTMYLDHPTNQQFTPHSVRLVWHFPMAFEDIWQNLISSSSEVSADRCSAVMLKSMVAYTPTESSQVKSSLVIF